MSNFKLTPVGTCRIFNPVKRASVTYPFEVNLSGIYGYVHTSAEALQQILFLLGELDIPESLQPCIFRPAGVGVNRKGDHERSDCYVVEISSAKKITANGFYLQSNYLCRRFPEFFSCPKRVKTFWSLVKKGIADELDLFLDSDPSFLELNQSGQCLIRSIRLSQMEEVEIARDMAKIVDLLGADHVIFMTHVDARMIDGEHIKSRRELINAVERISAELNVPCVNPTQIMEDCGQSLALEKDGRDLTHYTEVFGDMLFRSIFLTHIRPRLSGEDFAAFEMQIKIRSIADRIVSSLQENDLASAGALLFSSLRQYPEAPILIQLRAEIFDQIGYFEQALHDALQVEKVIGTTSVLSGIKLKALAALERWEETLAIAEAMLSDEIESENVLIAAAEASEALGMREKASLFWRKVTLASPDRSYGWTRYLSSLGSLGFQDEFNKVFDDCVAQFYGDARFLRTVAEQAITLGSEQVFVRALDGLLATKPLEAIGVVRGVALASLIDLAATSIERLSELAFLGLEVKEKLQLLAEQWIARAKALESEQTLPSLSAAFVHACASQKLYPGRDVAVLCRRLRLSWRSKIRALYLSGEYWQVADGARIAGSLLAEEPESLIYYIRSLIQLKSYDAACLLIHKVLGRNVSLHALHRLSLRSARNADDVLIAADTTILLLQLQDAFDADDLALLDKLRRSVSFRLLKSMRTRIVEQQLEEACRLLERLEKIETDTSKVDRERKLIAREFRERLLVAHDDDTAPSDRLDVALSLLKLDPESAYALKCAAVDSMRVGRYEQALDFWQRLENILGASDGIASQINRCVFFVEKTRSR